MCQKLRGNNIISRLLQGLWLHKQREAGTNTTRVEAITNIMMLYKNTKETFCFPDGDTDYFDIVAGVLWKDTLAPYLFIICLDFVLWKSIDKLKDNFFKLTKERSRRYPAQTITDADYADDIALLANTKTLLHSLERAAAGIGLHVNAYKTE